MFLDSTQVMDVLAKIQTSKMDPDDPQRVYAGTTEVQVPGGLVERTEADAVGAVQAAGLTPRVVSERSTTVPSQGRRASDRRVR